MLLFDDDEETKDIMMDYLDDEFDVTWVKNKEELEEKIERDYYAVILVDVSIKNSTQSGFEIIEEIRKKYRVTTTPIVIYSAVRNVEEIKKEKGKTFYSYVPKIGRDWQGVLLKECLKACGEKRRNTSATVLQSYFEKLGKIDSEINPSEIPDIFSSVLNGNGNSTIRSMIKLLENSDMDDGSWELLDETLWKKYDRYSQQETIKR